MENVQVVYSPSFEDVCSLFNAIIDLMIVSVLELPRIEHLLFVAVENLNITFIKSVALDEELVVLAKDRIKTVIYANSHGPMKYDLVSVKFFLSVISY